MLYYSLSQNIALFTKLQIIYDSGLAVHTLYITHKCHTQLFAEYLQFNNFKNRYAKSMPIVGLHLSK